MDSPVEDAAFMARIGAKLRPIGVGTKRINKYLVGTVSIGAAFGPEYELTNAVTGTVFTFGRVDYSYTDAHHWILLRGECIECK